MNFLVISIESLSTNCMFITGLYGIWNEKELFLSKCFPGKNLEGIFVHLRAPFMLFCRSGSVKIEVAKEIEWCRRVQYK